MGSERLKYCVLHKSTRYNTEVGDSNHQHSIKREAGDWSHRLPHRLARYHTEAGPSAHRGALSMKHEQKTKSPTTRGNEKGTSLFRDKVITNKASVASFDIWMTHSSNFSVFCLMFVNVCFMHVCVRSDFLDMRRIYGFVSRKTRIAFEVCF